VAVKKNLLIISVMFILLALIGLLFINSNYGKQSLDKMALNNFKKDYNKNKPIDVEVRGIKSAGNSILDTPTLTDEEKKIFLDEFHKSVFYKSVDNNLDKTVNYPIEMYYANGNTLRLRYYGHSFFLVNTKGRSFVISNDLLEKVIGEKFDEKIFTYK
jgi:hypothetical protein